MPELVLLNMETEPVVPVVVSLEVVPVVVEVEITKFMSVILIPELLILCFYRLSNRYILLFTKLRSFVTLLRELAKDTVLSNLEIKKKVNAPFRKCLANRFLEDQSK